jgi:hypothetical protein
LFDSFERDSLQSLPQRGKKLPEEKSAVAALEPQLVVVHDDEGVAHTVFGGFTQARSFVKL